MDIHADDIPDEKREELRQWVLQKRYGHLLTRTISAIGVAFFIGLFVVAGIRWIPTVTEKIMAFF